MELHQKDVAVSRKGVKAGYLVQSLATYIQTFGTWAYHGGRTNTQRPNMSNAMNELRKSITYSLNIEHHGIYFWRFPLKTPQPIHPLCDPEPNLLPHIPRVQLRPNLCVERRLARPDICLARLDKARALEDLPKEIQTQIDGNTDVSGHEISDCPIALCEDCEAVEEDDDGKVDESKVGCVWLPGRPEDEGVAVDVLSDQGFAEAQVGD